MAAELSALLVMDRFGVFTAPVELDLISLRKTLHLRLSSSDIILSATSSIIYHLLFIFICLVLSFKTNFSFRQYFILLEVVLLSGFI